MLANARHLDPALGVKPLDFGLDGVTGSVDACGRLIALNTYHPQHGYATLAVAEPFAEQRRYDPASVRTYRAALAAQDGFGPHIDSPLSERAAYLLDDAIPHVRLRFENGAVARSTTFAHAGGAIQIWDIEGELPRWKGNLALQRCAYTQLTEGGPLLMPDTLNRVTCRDGVLVIDNPALPLAAAIAGLPHVPPWTQETRQPVPLDFPGSEGTTVLAYGFGTDAATAHRNARALLRTDARQTLDVHRQQWRTWLANVPESASLRRGLVYGRALVTPLDDAGGPACILTDHMLLPLSWNRDAYYVARALLSWHTDMQPIVRRHLLWLFEAAERPDGIWARCYTANGAIKDRAYQLDQQLFPLLELADYVIKAGDHALAERVQPQVAPIRAALLARKAEHAWLFPTDETPADDPVALPYHLSSHILLWHTLHRLGAAGLGDTLALDPQHIRAAIDEHFITERDGTRMYAYATDGREQYHFYHDANDMPLALAPTWGFVPASNPAWRATIDFAFSDANTGGYYTNGLGSVHTPAPWPLGEVQNLIIARTLNDTERERRALLRLYHQQQFDGALPEASDPHTDAVVSRHWFAWPNAALACELLGAFAPERKAREPLWPTRDDLTA